MKRNIESLIARHIMYIWYELVQNFFCLNIASKRELPHKPINMAIDVQAILTIRVTSSIFSEFTYVPFIFYFNFESEKKKEIFSFSVICFFNKKKNFTNYFVCVASLKTKWIYDHCLK